jgi:hypothetical protein
LGFEALLDSGLAAGFGITSIGAAIDLAPETLGGSLLLAFVGGVGNFSGAGALWYVAEQDFTDALSS